MLIRVEGVNFVLCICELSCLTQDDIGETALITAVRQGHYEVVDILLRHGANVNLRNKVRYCFSLIAACDRVSILIHSFAMCMLVSFPARTTFSITR